MNNGSTLEKHLTLYKEIQNNKDFFLLEIFQNKYCPITYTTYFSI